jgi:hypothetical protein
LKRSLAVVSFLLWTGIILSTYYVFQNPGLLKAFAGLMGTFWTLLTAALLLFSAYGIGSRVLAWLGWEASDETARLLLRIGTGLGGLGLFGLIFSVLQIARQPVLVLAFSGITIFFLLSGDLVRLRADLRGFSADLNLSISQYDLFTKVTLILLISLPFMLALAPQFEAFDALLYHFSQPAQVLQDGGLRPMNVPHFWFPNLTENVYLWGLGLGSERLAQIIHLAWGVLSALLLWRWAAKFWSIEIGRKTLLLLAAIPSLPMLASWAYADLALVFYAVAVLYALTFYESGRSVAWLHVAGVMAGLAMTIKYTSFTVPLTAGLLILFWRRSTLRQAVSAAARFSLIAMITALPWYIRNTVMMGNPFYPFAFGGLYWDSFRANWYASAGTGVGWSASELLLLPLNTTLGHRDANFFDGRMGPLFLLLAPLALWVLLKGARQDSDRGIALQVIGVFAAVSFAAWTFGVIQSGALWQARLLLPALIPFLIPNALGWEALSALDSAKLRVSFFATALIVLVIGLTVFDNVVFVIQRNPLALAIGAQSRQGYIERVNPSYAGLMQIMADLPARTRVYSLFEPRSYGLPRPTQPDPINDNFFHDLHLYHTPEEIIKHWKMQGYTHILVYERGMSLITGDEASEIISARKNSLRQTLQRLELVQQTADRIYSIYSIP